ncbi:MAG: AAA family ATPase, partial [Anaerolineae bacterium]
MAAYPVLRTKLHIPPIRPELVSRPRLIERLNAGLPGHGDGFARKLTLVSAPAGFGKTTLVSEWVQGMGRAALPTAVAWLSLDERDNDLVRFLAYLVASLQTDAPDVVVGLLAALQSPQPPSAEWVLTALLNETAAISERFILVLDDYHVIDSKAVDGALTFLLDHLPPQMHLV